MQGEGSLSKPEVVRGVAGYLVVRPVADGRLLSPVSTPALVAVYDPSGASLAGETFAAPTVEPDGSIAIGWTPSALLSLGEDYRAEVSYTFEGKTRTEVLFFDLVRVSLACPLDDRILAGIEPDLPKWLASRGLGDARAQIVAAWDEIVARIRSAGYRPALVTSRYAFTAPAAHLALAAVASTLIQTPGDKWDRKREIHMECFTRLWSSLGQIRFALDPERTTSDAKRTSLPFFRI